MVTESTLHHSIASNRDVLRYLDPAESNGDDVPRSSSDPCLTAFVQLAAIRLGAKRGFICLTSREMHYIVAESGPTLSLQQTDDATDRLWYGVGHVSPDHSPIARLEKILSSSNGRAPVIVKDALLDERCKPDKPSGGGEGHPDVRFLACVPLYPPQSENHIGYLIVADTAPRTRISGSNVTFLTDMGTTVMDYLEIERARRAHRHSERMIKALGLFLAQKESLREWWLHTGHNAQPADVLKGMREGKTMENMADTEFGHPTPDLSAPVADPFDGPQDGATVRATPDHDLSSAHATSGGDSDNTTSRRQYKPSDDTHKTELSKDLRGLYTRAGNLIREALSVDGVIMVDPGFSTTHEHAEKDGSQSGASSAGSSDTSCSTSESEISGQDRQNIIDEDALPELQPSQKLCRTLCLSLHSEKAALPDERQQAPPQLPQRAMRKLMRRYPLGHVFNFNTAGGLSSDTDSLGTNSGANSESAINDKRDKRKLSFREQTALAISTALPGARSVAWLPLWDQRKENWLLGTFVWTYSPVRVLWPEEELTYITSFGHSITAELSRISALNTTRVQRDFISSVSHELRSPLHGVLASVEFLQETPMTELQIDMVNNIQDSSKVLLDTINHVLSFSKMEDPLEQTLTSGSLGSFNPAFHRSSGPVPESTDVCQLLEEVLNTVYAGRNMGTVSQSASGAKVVSPNTNASPVSVVVSVDYFSDYRLPIDVGAWRRILMNLFSNSLKYTEEGFVKVSLKLVPAPLSRRRGKSAHNLILKIKDSGIGMSDDFLQHHLSKPFSQENDMTAGTGLGLSIVSGIIRNLKGHIGFNSAKGSGTEVTVRLPFSTVGDSVNEKSSLSQIRGKTVGLNAMIEGFNRPDGSTTESTASSNSQARARRLLKSSIRTTLSDWFGLKIHNALEASLSDMDILVLYEPDDEQEGQRFINEYRESRQQLSATSLVVVLCQKFSFRETIDEGLFKIVYLCQPFGPHKLGKALHTAFAPETTLKYGSDRGSAASPTKPASHLPPTSPAGPRKVRKLSADDSDVERGDETPRTGNSQVLEKDPLNLKALIVDDNAINLRVLSAYLRKLEVDFVTASNGLEAFEVYKASSKDIDIIFMDISMPIMSGADSTRAIREFERQNNIHPVPVVALTASTSTLAQQEALNAGMDRYVTKPVRFNSFKPFLDQLKEFGREQFERPRTLRQLSSGDSNSSTRQD